MHDLLGVYPPPRDFEFLGLNQGSLVEHATTLKCRKFLDSMEMIQVNTPNFEPACQNIENRDFVQMAYF